MAKDLPIQIPEAFVAVNDWINQQPRDYLTTYERVILSVLAGYMNERRQAYPSIYSIADRAGCSEKTVQRTLRSLEEKGLIETSKNFGSSDTRVITERVFGSDQGDDPIDGDSVEAQPARHSLGSSERGVRSGGPTITDTGTPLSRSREKNHSVVDGQSGRGGGDETRHEPPLRPNEPQRWIRSSSPIPPGPEIQPRLRELLQPLVDHLLAGLVERDQKKEKYLATDRLEPIWFHAVERVVNFEEFYRDSDVWQHSDPRWFEVIDDALDAMKSVGAKQVRPDSTELVSELRKAREARIVPARPDTTERDDGPEEWFPSAPPPGTQQIYGKSVAEVCREGLGLTPEEGAERTSKAQPNQSPRYAELKARMEAQ